MTKIGILGSKVSHEIFTFIKTSDYNLICTEAFYIARQGITSSLSKGSTECIGNIGKTEYQNKVLYIDIAKKLFEVLQMNQAEYLLIDFIDERFDLIKIGETYITGSYECLQSEYLKNREFERIQKVQYVKENEELFREQIKVFCEHLLTIYAPSQIILHECYFGNKYYDKHQNIQMFQKNILKTYQTMNDLLTLIYGEVKKNIKGCISIGLPQESVVVKEENQSQPLYSNDYYCEILKQLENNKVIKAYVRKEEQIKALLKKEKLQFCNLEYLPTSYSKSLFYGENSLNVLEIANKAVEGEVVLRPRTILERTEDIWNTKFLTNELSNKLYFYGLDWVGTLVYSYKMTGEKKYYDSADWYIRTFIEWYGYTPEKVYFPYSCDHSYYLRVSILLYARKEFPQDWGLVDEINHLLVDHLLWLVQDKNFQLNNHGVMSTLALWYLGIYIQNKELKEYIYKIAMDRTLQLVDHAFDSDGMCVENSPEYFEYNILLFRNILDVLHYNHIYLEETKKIESLMQQVEKVNAILLRQDNYFQNIGDTTIRKSKYTSMNGNYYFKNSNTVIIKDQQRYFSYVCGYTSLVHKHADDMSFTLRHRDRDIIVDSGLYCYDKQNKIRRYMESSQGHAKCYPKSLVDKISVEYGKEIIYASIENYQEYEDYIQIKSMCKLLNGLVCNRNLNIFPQKIIIEDSWKMVCDEDMYVEFPLHPKTNILAQTGNTWRFINQEIPFSIHFDCTIEGVSADIHPAWYSESFGKVLESTSLRITIPSIKEGKITTILDFG